MASKSVVETMRNASEGMIKRTVVQEPHNCLVEYYNGFAEVIHFQTLGQAQEFQITISRIKKTRRFCVATDSQVVEKESENVQPRR